MKSWEKYLVGAGAGAGGFFAGSYALQKAMMPTERADVGLDDTKVSIHVASYNEENTIRETLESLVNQEYYKLNGDVKIVLLDSDSTDDTRDIARQYLRNEHIWLVPKGKLSARHNGIVRDEEADIILATDADCIYPKHWLSNMVKPFEDYSIVGVYGHRLSKEDPFWKPLRAYWTAVSHGVWKQFLGCNSGFRRWAYFEAGGFDLSVDEFDRMEIWQEEEWDFRKRLEEVGKVEHVTNSGILTSDRHMPFTLSETDYTTWKKEREEGLRF